MPIETVYEALVSSGCNPKRSSNGYSAKVPGRVDRHPSLSVFVGGNGWVKLVDHAKKSTEAQILLALGLSNADLAPAASAKPKPDQVEAEYRYQCEDGTELFTVRRFAGKVFVAGHYVGSHWITGLNGSRKVLYKVPELIEGVRQGKPIYVAEGEKDVDRLFKAGVVATCNPFGAGKWLAEYSGFLKGASVIIIVDKDDTGRKHGQSVAQHLKGVAASIRTVEAKHGKDAFDHLAAGFGVEDFVDICVDDPAAPTLPKYGSLLLVSVSDLINEEPSEVPYLVDGMMPMGGTSLIAAKPKVGKSTLVRWLALCVARGEPFLGRETVQGPVIYLAIEERRDEVRKDFLAMGVTESDNIQIHFGAVISAEVIEELGKLIRYHGAILAIIDPIFKAVQVRSTDDYAEVSKAMGIITRLADETNCHICCPHHAGKQERGDGDSVLGSTAIFGGVDCLIELRKTREARYVKSIQRYGVDLEDSALTLDLDTQAVTISGTVKEAKLTSAKEKIKEVLALVQPVEEKDLKLELGGDQAICSQALRELFAEGVVTRTGLGRRGNPYLWELAAA